MDEDRVWREFLAAERRREEAARRAAEPFPLAGKVLAVAGAAVLALWAILEALL